MPPSRPSLSLTTTTSSGAPLAAPRGSSSALSQGDAGAHERADRYRDVLARARGGGRGGARPQGETWTDRLTAQGVLRGQQERHDALHAQYRTEMEQQKKEREVRRAWEEEVGRARATREDGEGRGGGRRNAREEEEEGVEDGEESPPLSPARRRRDRSRDRAADGDGSARALLRARRRSPDGRRRSGRGGERDERSVGKGLVHPLEGRLRRLRIYGEGY
ncbi:hypothetical protein JCM6882_005294 [Rhodosporidiobolus microsporus]